jgi:RluA family pseudouridine synthase
MTEQVYIPDHILYEDDVIIVLNKPAGLMVEPDRNNYPNLQQLVKKYLKLTVDTPEVYAQHIHRLDRPVSGVILFAKQKTVLKNLSEQFAERKVSKYYQALTAATPSHMSGTLENWFRKEKKKATLYDEEIPFSEKVKLDYSVRELSEQRFQWDIQLHTGKYHQIRAQLSYVNCPVIGDSLYGSTIPYRENAVALHACKLIFRHPVTNAEMSIEKQNDFDKSY